MNALDTLIGAVSPGWLAGRQLARLRTAEYSARLQLMGTILHDLDRAPGGFSGRYHDAARQDRTSADWPSTVASADGGIVPDEGLMNARARAAVSNDWAARSIRDAFRRHVVGIGITPRSAARDPETGKETDAFRAFNERIDRMHDHWAHRPWLCDVEKTKNIAEIDGLAVCDFVTVGQAFCLHTFAPRRGSVGMQIQMFEVEQLDWTLTVNPDTGNEIRNGIEIDTFGTAVAFWLHTGKHPLDTYAFGGSTRIPADRVYHVIRQERVRQTHGLTRLSAVLEDIYQLKGYKQAEAVAKRLEACIGLRLRYEQWYQPDGMAALAGLGTMPVSGAGTGDARGNPKVRFEPGMVTDAGFGRYYETTNPQRPGPQFESYVDRIVRQIAAGAGSDSAHTQRSFHEGNFSSQRQGALEHDRETDPIQFNLLIDQWARPRREAFKLYAVLQGLVKAPGMFEDDVLMMAYLEDDWQGPPKPWVDPANQSEATERALRMGLTDLRKEKNILGGNWRDGLYQRRDEQEMAESLSLYLGWLYDGKTTKSETVQKSDRNPPEKSRSATARSQEAVHA
jgi:lambda family phage portal protein